MRDETPQQMKLPYALWTLSLIRELIHRRLKVSVSLASVSRIHEILGFFPKAFCNAVRGNRIRHWSSDGSRDLPGSRQEEEERHALFRRRIRVLSSTTLR
ncbi:MAG: winged helix-turn-helix domain-containing protein [Gammaproteobacteria bacterium]|nr:winged helix-turn-helix domain-containing protein [Gammaproteobacteria bacterium]